MGAAVKTLIRQPGRQFPLAQNSGPGAVIVSGQSIYEESATKYARIGERLQLGDRVFRYAYSAGAIVSGYLVQAPALGGATTTLQTTQPVAVAAAAGDSRIYTTALTTAQDENLFEDGWVAVHDDSTGGAFLMRIKGNSALATTGTSSYLDLYDGLPVALTTSDQLEIITNPYKNVVTSSSATVLTGALLGVAPAAISASGKYFWLQTWGPAAVVPYAALDLDEFVTQSKDTAGQVQKSSVATNTMQIGLPLAIGTAAEGAIIFLTLAP